MKLSLNWLKEYVDLKMTTSELVDRLTMAGLEVEGVESVGKDTVIELEVTPNRADCLSVLGLARDIGALTYKKVRYPLIKKHSSLKLTATVKIENRSDCNRYIATLLTNAKVAAVSSHAGHLASVGIRSISNAVDITNFILMEMGQPLHVFDYDKIDGGQVVVRRARAGEDLVTLDGIERKLDPSILVIADAKKPIAIAGIMGGLATQVTATTTTILLESACFNPVLIRKACRTLGLRSDSSYRFERGIDINGVLTAANRATDLLVVATGAKFVGRKDIYSESKAKLKPITISSQDVKTRLGLNLKDAQIKKSLTALGFKVIGSKTFKVIAPSFRPDVKQTVDLIEEIARMMGFDHLPMAMPTIKAKNIIVDERPRAMKKQWRAQLLAAGLDEVVTLSMTNHKALKRCQLDSLPSIAVFNPLSIDQELMRPSLLPSLMQVAVTNINRGQKDLRFFEFGKRYLLHGEKETLGVLMTGRRYADWRLNKKEGVDIVDLKGVLQELMHSIGVAMTLESIQWPVVDAQCGAAIHVNGKSVGVIGKLDKQIVQNWDIKNQDVYFATIDLESFFVFPHKTVMYKPIAEFPAVVRDVSLALKRDVPYEKIEVICSQKGGTLLKAVNFIEEYTGDKIAADQKALVFSLVYQSNDRTLREEEVNAIHETIIQTLIQDLPATRR